MITEHSKVEKSQAFSLFQVWISIYLNLSFLEVKQTLHHQPQRVRLVSNTTEQYVLVEGSKSTQSLGLNLSIHY